MPGEPLLHTEHPNDPLQFLSERYQQLKVLDNYKNDLIEVASLLIRFPAITNLLNSLTRNC